MNIKGHHKYKQKTTINCSFSDPVFLLLSVDEIKQ